MKNLAGLDVFLAALRARGIPIGVEDVERLKAAFAAEPQLDRDGLRSLLRCALAKNRDEGEVFDQEFAAWCPEEVQAPSPGDETIEAWDWSRRRWNVPEPIVRPRVWWKRLRTYVVAGILIACVCVGFALWLREHEPIKPPVPPVPPPGLTIDTAPFAKEERRRDPIPEDPNQKPPDCTEYPPGELIPVRADLDRSVTVGVPQPCLSPFVRTWVPVKVEVLPAAGASRAWLVWAGLASLGLVTLGWLWRRYVRLHGLPPPAEPATPDGPTWLPFLPVERGPVVSLAPESKRTLVWGLGRFLSQDETRKVDLDRTVRATARNAGIPEIHRERATYPRALWIWEDELAAAYERDALADELALVLTRANLPVKRGTFLGVPNPVSWERDDAFSPLDVEGHRQHAIVLLLTDGEALVQAWSDGLERPGVTHLLRHLSAWPRLAIVDVGTTGGAELRRLLRRFQLQVLQPEDVASYVASFPSPRGRGSARLPDRLLGDARTWAAATALPGEPVDFARAERLAKYLGLTVDRWSERKLFDEARVAGGRLEWSSVRRREHLSWLVASERHEGATVAPGSTLGQALAFWKRTYAEERTQRLQTERPLHVPYEHSRAEQHVRIREAMLDLWDRPDRAAPVLHGFVQDASWREEIQQELRGFCAVDQVDRRPVARDGRTPGAEPIVLPWSWRALSLRTRWLLSRLGFAEGRVESYESYRMPKRFRAAIGVLAGLSLAWLAQSVWSAFQPPPIESTSPPAIGPDASDPKQAQLDHPTFRLVTIQEAVDMQDGTYTTLLGTAKHLRVGEAGPGERARITWEWKDLPSRVRLGDGDAELWLAGRLAQPIRSWDGDGSGVRPSAEAGQPEVRRSRRSLVVIEGDLAPGESFRQESPGNVLSAAGMLAAKLLDSGSADRVLIGRTWRDHLDALIEIDPQFTQDDQLVLILPQEEDVPELPAFQGRLAVLARHIILPDAKRSDEEVYLRGLYDELERWPVDLGARGVRPIYEVWPNDVRFLTPIGPERVCVWQHGFPGGAHQGITFIQVPAGAFSMGGHSEGDHGGPIHPVVLSSFWIGEFEFDLAAFVEGGESNPADLFDIAEELTRRDPGGAVYCLPTEAQWEYACRAGSDWLYCFGDDVERLSDYAIWGGSGPRTHSAARCRNALGLFDLHGRAWEMTLDGWHYGYVGGIQVDPVRLDSEHYSGFQIGRMMRGGSSAVGESWALCSGYRPPVDSSLFYYPVGYRLAGSRSWNIPRALFEPSKRGDVLKWAPVYAVAGWLSDPDRTFPVHASYAYVKGGYSVGPLVVVVQVSIADDDQMAEAQRAANEDLKSSYLAFEGGHMVERFEFVRSIDGQ